MQCILVIMLKDSGWWDFIASVKTSTNSDINTDTVQLTTGQVDTIHYYTPVYYNNIKTIKDKWIKSVFYCSQPGLDNIIIIVTGLLTRGS